MVDSPYLTPAQLVLVAELARCQPATVRELHNQCRSGVAYRTTATRLRRLARSRVLTTQWRDGCLLYSLGPAASLALGSLVDAAQQASQVLDAAAS